MPILADYNHFGGRHWETGSVHNYYAYRGVTAPHTGEPYSEALLMGVSGGAVMGYFAFAYEGYDPMARILATAKLGTSVWGGISHRGLELSEKAVDDILRKELVIAGSWNSSFAPLRSDWGTSIKLMGLGKIRAGNIITHRLPLERIKEAFQMMLAREEYFNKVMFFPEM